jgi:hypothetical protein
MFEKVRYSELDLVALGERMQDRRRSLKGGPATRAVWRIATLLSSPTPA